MCKGFRDGAFASFTIEQCRTMINFISVAAMKLIVAPFFVSRKEIDFMMMLLFILLIDSTQC